eukprot:GHVH01006605.1.p1 GENE.GHVH01006605.1~~GHVH01006605.1.p1  ORF type:complete len:231 (+),score=34.32 GHVH01006605.1:29-694(+)
MAKHGGGKKKGGKPKTVKPTDQRLTQSYKSRVKSLNKKGNTVVKDERALVEKTQVVRREAPNSALYFSYNEQLGPPYQVLCDTNFFNFCMQNKLDPIKGIPDFLVAKTKLFVTDCILGELEKNHRFKMSMMLAKNPSIKRLTCCHKGTYADDCIIQRITNHRCYIVATNDKELKQRIRKIPGVPVLYVGKGKFGIERMPDSVSAVRMSDAGAATGAVLGMK